MFTILGTDKSLFNLKKRPKLLRDDDNNKLSFVFSSIFGGTKLRNLFSLEESFLQRLLLFEPERPILLDLEISCSKSKVSS